MVSKTVPKTFYIYSVFKFMTVEFLQIKTKDSVEFAKQIELTFSFFIFNEKTKRSF